MKKDNSPVRQAREQQRKNTKEQLPHADPVQYSGADEEAVARTNEEVDERLYDNPESGDNHSEED